MSAIPADEDLAVLDLGDLLTLRATVKVAQAALKNLPEDMTAAISVDEDGGSVVICVPRHEPTNLPATQGL